MNREEQKLMAIYQAREEKAKKSWFVTIQKQKAESPQEVRKYRDPSLMAGFHCYRTNMGFIREVVRWRVIAANVPRLVLVF